MKKYLLFILITALGAHCTHPENVPGQSASASATISDTIQVTDLNTISISGTNTSSKIRDTAILINDTIPIALGIFTKDAAESNIDNNDPLAIEIKKWTLDTTQIKSILKGFKPVNGPDIHYRYLTFYPQMSGEVTINGKVYRMNINAGSYFILTNKDTSYLFGDETKRFRKLFLTGADEERYDN